MYQLCFHLPSPTCQPSCFLSLLISRIIFPHYLDIYSGEFQSVAVTTCSGLSMVVKKIRHQPGSLFVNSFKEVKALRDKGLNGDYEDGRIGICVFFLSSPGEQPLYLQGEAVAPCQAHSHSGSGEISCHPPPR